MNGIIMERYGAVQHIELDAPPVNALTLARYAALTEIFQELSSRDDVHCVVLGARGSKAFCAGLDLHEFLATPVEEDHKRQEIGLATFRALQDCPIPVIASVNGPALGAGCVLASLCDIRIGSENATFGLPEINVGRCGGAAYVGRLIPQGSLRRMFFTGEAIDADEAHRIGLLDEVVSSATLLESSLALARRIAQKSPLGLRIGKRALNECEGLRADEGYAIEQRHSGTLVSTADSREALRAVVERRPPVFLGR
jgi:enoyl-CoA hydratase